MAPLRTAASRAKRNSAPEALECSWQAVAYLFNLASALPLAALIVGDPIADLDAAEPEAAAA